MLRLAPQGLDFKVSVIGVGSLLRCDLDKGKSPELTFAFRRLKAVISVVGLC